MTASGTGQSRGPASLVERVRAHARSRPERVAFRFLRDGEEEQESLTYAELDRRVTALAARLRGFGEPGARALLLFPPGLHFVTAFLACLDAGSVAVPAYPPKPSRSGGRPGADEADARLTAIVADARPSLVLTESALAERLESPAGAAGPLEGLSLLAVDEATAGSPPAPGEGSPGLVRPRRGTDPLAFLQYTSGSTAAPKGVMVTHGNLLANEVLIQQAFGTSAESVVVSWLPLYHDMGLIGGVLHPLFLGATCILMSPMAFLQQPARWLKAVSRYRATTSGGPSFAYDLCRRRVRDEQLAGADLSSWTVAFNGAEPVRAGALERFAERFAPWGFRRRSFFPCYGLAEATLFVAGAEVEGEPVVRDFEAPALEQDRAVPAEPSGGSGENKEGAFRRLVSCGRTRPGLDLLVVDPASRRPRADGAVGEIWIAGESVARGYWKKPEASAQAFEARLAGEPQAGPFLRTGDLGFLHDGELYVAGRLKDLIILRGRNHYPQDLELTAERAHEALRPGCAAAFAVDAEGGEHLVVVLEAARGAGLEGEEAGGPAAVEICDAVRRALAEGHEVAVHEVVLLQAGSILKTSSGKIRRRACRQAYGAGELREIFRSGALPQARPGPAPGAGAGKRETAGGGAEEGSSREGELLRLLGREERRPVLLALLRQEAARALEAAPEALDAGRPLTALGLDSLAAVEVQGGVERRLGMELPLSRLLEGASLEGLAAELAEALDGHPPAAATAPAPGPAEGGPGEGGGELAPSEGQKALWFLHSLAPGGGAYTVAAGLRILSPLDPGRLRRAFEHLVGRHGALRTVFAARDGEPLRRVLDEVPEGVVRTVRLEEGRAGAGTWNDPERLRGLLSRLVEEPFDLEAGPLVRLTLLEPAAAGEGTIAVLTVHHAVTDFWSLAGLARELAETYGRLRAGAEPPAPPTLPGGPSYGAFVSWQKALLAGPRGGELWAYWRERLRDPPEALDLPLDRPRPPVQTFKGALRLRRLGPAAAEAAGRLQGEGEATLFTVLLAADFALLHRLSGQGDLLLGSPTAGRPGPEYGAVQGYFVNPLVLRSRVEGDPPFHDFLAGVRRTVLEAFDHRHLPFPLLTERLQPERDASRPPLVQSLFVLQKAREPELEALAACALGEGGVRFSLAGLEAESLALPPAGAAFDLSLRMARLGGRLVASFEYNPDLFDGTTVERWLGSFERLLAAAEPGATLGSLPLLSAAQEHQLVHEWNGVGTVSSTSTGADGALLHRAFEAFARRRPDAPALLGQPAAGGEPEVLTYGELARRAAALAHRLRRRGVGTTAGGEERVGILLERTPRLVVALLAVLEAGGAYVPLDPAYPEERLRFMVEDSGARLVLADGPPAAELPGVEILAVGDAGPEEGEEADPEPLAPPAGGWHSRRLAYVIYTSGSTGRPKGVALEHGSAAALLAWARAVFSAEELSGVLAATSVCFDLSVFELFVPLSAGGVVVLARDALELPSLAAREEVRLVNTVPSALAALIETGGLSPGVTTVNLAGEALPGSLVDAVYESTSAARVLNLYGPSEDTTYSTFAVVPRRRAGEPPRTPTIGRPVAGGRAYVFDPRGRLVPPGVPGELFLGGAGVARGYQGRPALTAERFLPDPFATGPGERLYRTGDLVRARPDGELLFIGRRDHQVKVRGFRIELGEIEAALRSDGRVQEAVAVARPLDEGRPEQLSVVAYAVAAGEAPAEGSRALGAELRERLGRRLPPSMVPARVVVLDALPRTPNGKVDRRALPRPERAGGEAGGAGPLSPLEEALAGLWADLLGTTPRSPEASFFDLGGHSLMAARLDARIRAAFGVELGLVEIFQAPTLSAMARRLESARGEARAAPRPPLEREPGRRWPLSFSQERLWFLSRWAPESAAYNVYGALRLRGPLELRRWSRALGEVLARHAILRCVFEEGPEGPGAVVQDRRPELPVVDLRRLPEPVREPVLRALSRRFGRRPFDLGRGPLLRAAVVRLDKSEHAFFLNVHHVAADGWSQGILFRELAELYRAPRPAEALAELPLQFGDFARWQRRWLRGEELEGQLSFWRRALAGAPDSLELPFDRPRPPRDSDAGGRRPFVLERPLVEALNALGRRAGATPAMVLLAGFASFLARLAGQDDLLLGAPVARRPDPRLEGLVGFFVNTLVMRIRLGGRPGFTRLLEEVRDGALGAYAHQDFPFELLVQELAPRRELARNPLVQVLFAYQNVPRPALEVEGLEVELLTGEPVETGTSKFDLSLFLSEEGIGGGPGGLEAAFEYSTDLFDGTTVERFAAGFRALLAGAAAKPEVPVAALPVLSPGQRQQVVVEANDTVRPGASGGEPGSLAGLVAAQGAATPEAPAVEAAGEVLSYRRLLERSASLASGLAAHGVGRGDVVGLCLDRGLEQPLAVLAVLRAGAACMPLDPAYPPARLRLMVEDSGAGLVLTSRSAEEERAVLGPGAPPILRLEDLPAAERALPAVTAEDLAYVLYTSGSTGRPKGVAMGHGALVNLMRWQRASFGEPAAGRTLQLAALSFDVSFQEIFSAWSTGGTLVVLPPGVRRDPAALAAFIAEQRIERLFLPYVALEQLAEAAAALEDFGPPLRDVVTAGEQPRVGPALEALFTGLPGCRFWNQYGPTETHVVTAWQAPGDPSAWPRLPPVGRPVANTACHVLSPALEPLPPGAPGELFLAGRNLARGYLGRPAATAERFLPDPFPSALQGGARLYRTGDLARRRRDGSLQFLGRRDHQVKVRGHRVELGEIEIRLQEHPAVRQCAVAALGEGAGGQRLVAYWVAGEGPARPSPQELRRHLAEALPEPLVPGLFVRLEALPLTASGKVDRRRLPAPDAAFERSTPFVAPRNETEELLAGLWGELLGLEAVGAEDDFFDLGGHSLLATRLVSRVREELGVEVALRTLFEKPTVAALARAMAEADAEARRGSAPPLERQPRQGDPPLSFAQQRLWFLHRLAPESASYNMHGALRLTGAVEVAVLDRCLQEICRRHETLRTTFPEVDGRPVQRIAPEVRLPLPVVDLSRLREPEAAAWRCSRRQGRRPYDLARGPLARATLVRLGPGEHLLLLDLHHVISDGWSHGVAFRELSALYAAFRRGEPSPLRELPLQYADFALWQRRVLAGEALEELLAYWRRRLEGMPEALGLPVDRPRPARSSFLGGIRRRALGGDLTGRVRALARSAASTPAMVVLAALQALLARLAGQRDVPVGMAVANRNRRQVEELIGFFVNALVIRTDLGGEPSVEALVGQVRELCLEAYAHQDLPFDRLVEELAPDRRLDRDPLVQVMFGYQSFPRGELEIEGVTLEPVLRGEAVDTGTAKFDLTLFVYEEGDGLDAVLEHNREIFDGTTAQRLLGHLEALLRGAVAAPEAAIGDLALLDAGQWHQIVVEANDTRVAGRESLVIPEVFRAEARRRPEAVAVVARDGILTYGELARRAEALARELVARGVGPEEVVGVSVERSAALIVALLGILEAGGAYLPLEPDLPPARLEAMMEEARPRVLIQSSPKSLAPRENPQNSGLPKTLAPSEDSQEPVSPKTLAPRGEGAGPVVVEVGAAGVLVGGRGAKGVPRPLPVLGPESLAYVLYTSGSTGRPKGVAAVHQAVVRLVRDSAPIRFGEDEVFLLLAPVAFDASTLEIWGPLLNGGRLVVMPPGAPSLEELAAAVRENGVTTLWLTAGLFHQVVDGPVAELEGLRQLLAGGDVLSPDHVRRAREALPGCRLLNGYGPTENTTFTCCEVVGEVPPGASVPIGRPITETQVYVLDRRLRPLPTGAPGELLTGGRGLARGYLHQPRLTAERFVPHPFPAAPGERLYRTGDLVRRTSSGAITFLGRRDHQVKVRGFRIELGEIEARLVGHPAVEKAVVTVREEDGGAAGKRLVAYVVPEPEALAPQMSSEAGPEAADEQREQVARWQMIFDDLYRGEAPEADPTFNIIGWESTYTGEALPAADMAAWLEDTVDRIRDLRPRRLLEIGCGTGMILFRVAPGCELYVGTDASKSALDYLGRELGRRSPNAEVRLDHRSEGHFVGVEAGSLDTVVLNSVVQYFPTLGVLREVLDQALTALAPGGAVFLGDLRSLPLARSFYTSVELFQASRGTPLERLRQRVLTREIHEEELLVHPAFFRALAEDPRVARVEVLPKRGEARNELTAYRYQVVLRRAGAGAAEGPEGGWADWRELGSLEALRALLAVGPETLALRRIPNLRTAEASAAAELLLAGHEVESPGELRRRAGEAAAGALAPDVLRRAAEEAGYSAELGWADPGADGSFEAVLLRGSGRAGECRRILASLPVPETPAPLANQPLLGRYAQRMARDLRPYLSEALPEYMVPAAFVALPSLPLDANGKVDRRALPAPGLTRLELGEAYVAPRTEAEARIASLWAELLGLERVSVEDDFFGLGGHSLLATQIVSRLRRDFGVELPLRSFFEAPTVAGLAALVSAGDAAGGVPELPPVEAGQRGETAPLSFAQERLWFLHRLEPEARSYNEANGLAVEGPLEVEALEQALGAIVGRHEVLRTTFPEVRGRPMQRVAPESSVEVVLPVLDLGTLSGPGAEAETSRLGRRLARKGFDLSAGPLLRAALVRRSRRQHALFFCCHHVVFDGWSTGIFSRELSAFYGRLAGDGQGGEVPVLPVLPVLPVQYADFALWQRRHLTAEALAPHLDHWRRQLEGLPATLDLPTDRSPSARARDRGARVPARLPAPLVRRLRSLAAEGGGTLFMALLAGLAAVLGRWSHQPTVAVGSPVANRRRVEIEPLIGFFVNTLVLRTDLEPGATFRSLLAAVRQTALGAYDHQDLPFERLVEELQPERDLAGNPFFRVLFALQESKQGELRLAGLRWRPLPLDAGAAKVDLHLSLEEKGEEAAGWWEYRTDLFDGTTVQRLQAHLETLLKAASESPGRALEELPSLGPGERHQLQVEWSDGGAGATAEPCLHELVAAQVRRTPEQAALVHGGEAWTYGRLWEEVETLAGRLAARGVGPEVRVGVCLPRGPRLVTALLAVLEAGGAYVPLDPSLPEGRLAFVAEDAGASLLLLEGEVPAWAGGEALLLDGGEGPPPVPLTRPVPAARARSRPDNLAYVIYTSGSTGRPKGVAITHRGAAGLVAWARQVFTPEELRGVLASTSVGFDLSVFELFVPLACGGTVVLVEDALDLAELAELPELQGAPEVSLLNTVPSAFRELLRLGALPPTLRTVNLAGEALRRSLVAPAAELGTVERLFNLYGPSEDTTYSTWARVPLGGLAEPSIGRPVAGSRAYLSDRHLRTVGLGVTGEICLGGAGLARGYLGRPALTAERFVPDPFGGAGERLYRTGDLARHRKDGELDFLGRLDHQVKLRGFRIELGEIETALSRHEAVAEAVVAVRASGQDEPRLVAYVVAAPGAGASEAELREHLRRRLPEYMVPAAFVALEAFPLSPNGKVDRGKLPAPEAAALAGGAAEAPATPAEEVVAQVWCEVLGRPSVGRRESFFDLGGHSLMATRVVSRLAEIWQREVPVRLLFESPTVAAVARALEQASAGPELPPLEPRGEGPAPASFAQERLWFLDRFEVEPALYNLPMAVELEGGLDRPALGRALALVAGRQESLRTSFRQGEGGTGLLQVVAPPAPVPLPLVDLSRLGGARRTARALAEAEVRRGFDLARGPLLRTVLLRVEPEVHVLVVNQHHVVSDGWSLGLFADELAAAYGAVSAGEEPSLPELPVQFGDYAAWQRGWLRGKALERQLAYWRQRLQGAPDLLELPADRPRPALQSYRGAHLELRWPGRLGRAAAALAQGAGTSLFMTLLAVYQTLLARLAGTADVTVGTTIANRRQPALERLMGFFVNTLVLRTELAGAASFEVLLGRVREICLEAYDHQDVPFEKLVEELAPERDLSHTPLFQAVFMLQNVPPPERSFAGLERRLLPVDTGTSKFDLIVSMVEAGEGLEATVEYNRDLFDGSTVRRWMGSFAALLEAAAEAPELSPFDLPWLRPEERHQLLAEWNDTVHDAPAAAGLHRPFEERARQAPERPAVVTATESLSYGELNRRANRLAHGLKRRGVGRGDLVGVHLGRRPEMAVAVLAVLKAGAAYVPLEGTWPPERIRWIAETHGIRTLVSEASRLGSLAGSLGAKEGEQEGAGSRAVVFTVDEGGEAPPEALRVIPPAELEACPETDPPPVTGPEDLAYVIFTSGSTGRPKGVVERHAPAVNLVTWVNETFAVGPDDRLLFITALSFDLSVYDLFGILAAGGSVRLASEEEVSNPARLVEILLEEPVTFWDSAPAALQQCVPALPRAPSGAHLRLVFLSGDWIPVPLPDRLRQAFPRARVVALGGATEATVWSNYHLVGEVDPAWPSIPYGRPIWNARYHVLDGRLRPVPVGVAGDLYIAGPCLSTVYAAAPGQTARQYLPNPISEEAGDRLYRTGDRARHRSDGSLEFLGRRDTQVKVRGFRIELGEIETVLTRHDGVRESVVLVREDVPGDQRLVAYWTRGAGDVGPKELRSFLARRLPEYMLPSAFVEVEEWPVTATGKLDRKALPSPRAAKEPPSEAPAEAEAFRGDLEATIAEVWRQVLGSDQVGRRDNFFQLGGHSLLMARVQTRLEERLGRPVPVVDLFQHPTVASLAEHLGGDAAPRPTAAPAVRRGGAGESRKVAVVGMAGRFPGSPDLEAFWRNLRDGVECIRFFSDEEMRAAGVDEVTLADPRWVRARGMLEGADLFDAGFFGYSPREAQVLDPQQRLFLETAWNALEHAGYAPSRYPGRIGVYGGVSQNTYLHELMEDEALVATLGLQQLILANGNDYLPTRVSYELDLKGPSINVQTACSTSLVAVHLACLSLLQGDCDMALAGGSTVRSREVWGYAYEEGGIASPDGHTRAFDARAQGVVSGSGVGVVVLKRLEEALEDGDTVHAVVLGSAANNDGSRKVGFTAPGVDGQAQAVAEAYAAAGVDPRTVSYVEGHGTATPMGDPIEVAALTRAYRASTADRGFCALGSVKTNVGHLDAAAGIAGFVKTVLALEHRQLPPSLHFEEPNPAIDFASSPFFVNAELRPWQTNGVPRRAGVSSFGIGGTNAHVVLEEAPGAEPGGPSRPVQLLCLSAHTPTALAARCRQLADALEAEPRPGLADVAFTLAVGREELRHRRIAVCEDRASAVAALRGEAPEVVRSRSLPRDPAPPEVAFLFPGQGAQFPGMAARLYEEETVFREHLDRCAQLLEPHLGCSRLLDVVFGRAPEAASRLQQTALTQPALFAVEVSLARLWESWGVRPAVMLGHSLGEYVAACLAGVFSLEAALELVALRGRLMSSVPPGAMAAVKLSEEEVTEELRTAACPSGVELAAVNGAASCVVTGPEPAVGAFLEACKARGVRSRRLATSHAFHSAMMEPVMGEMEEAVARAAPSPPRIPFVSNVSGALITAQDACDPSYWARHLRRPVRFADGVAALLSRPGRVLLEVGPGHSLSRLARRCSSPEEAVEVVPSLGPSGQAGSDLAHLLEARGRLWLAGHPLDPEAFFAGEKRRRVPLPTYPFEGRRHWVGDAAAPPASGGEAEALEEAVSDFEAPRSPMEESVAAAFRELLGTELVGAHDDFFELGGSSLMAVQLGARLRDLLGLELPASLLLEATTVASLAKRLEALESGEGRDAPSDFLVPLRSGGSRLPLFLVHQVGGNVFTFRELVQALGAAQPVYGLRSPGLEPGEEPLTTVAAMAERYLERIRQVQPRGPYRLGGASMGGLVAFEMARRLAGDGQEVALLALMDSPLARDLPTRPRDSADLIVEFFQGQLELCPEELRQLEPEERIRHAIEKSGHEEVELGCRVLRVYVANAQALYAYEPETYKGPLLYFRAKERREVDARRPEVSWIDLASEGVEVLLVPGNHETMHEGEGARRMARRLQARLG